MRRSAVVRPSSAGACGLSTTPGGVPNANTVTSAPSACRPPAGPAGASTTAIHHPAHWKRTGSAMGTSPDPCSASQLRQAPSACVRSSSGRGRSVTGTSVTDARQAANPRASAPAADPGGSSTSITGPPEGQPVTADCGTGISHARIGGRCRSRPSTSPTIQPGPGSHRTFGPVLPESVGPTHFCHTPLPKSGAVEAAEGQGDGEGCHDDGDEAVEDLPGGRVGEDRAEQPGAVAQGGEPDGAAQAGAGGELPAVLAVGGGHRAQQQHRVQVDVWIEPGQRQAAGEGQGQAGAGAGAGGVGAQRAGP